MKVQSDLNVLSKVGPISPYYISIFAFISKTKGYKEKSKVWSYQVCPMTTYRWKKKQIEFKNKGF